MHESDLYIAAGVVAAPAEWTFRSLADHLRVPLAGVQRGLMRLEEAELYDPKSRRLHAPNLEEFVIHGLRFLAPARLGGLTSGVPAAWGVGIMSARLNVHEPPPVWPHPMGTHRGSALKPLHKAAPDATQWFSRLGDVLAVIDSLRFHDRRIRRVAGELWKEAMRDYARGRTV